MASIRPLETQLTRIVRETADTVTLCFQSDRPFVYKAGQFCTIDPHQFKQLESLVLYLEQLKGKREPPRAYSMSSAPGEAELAVTVKEEIFDKEHCPYPPLLSGLLVHGLVPGMPLHIVGFTGPYVLADPVAASVDHLVHVCAGSGIVPNFSILKDALERQLPLRHTLIYANKTHADIIFRDAIDALGARHPGQLRVIHQLSREPEPERHGPNYRHGRITERLLAEVIGTDPGTHVYLCGPGITPHESRAARKEGRTATPRFLETMIAALRAVGVDKDRLNYESYG